MALRSSRPLHDAVDDALASIYQADLVLKRAEARGLDVAALRERLVTLVRATTRACEGVAAEAGEMAAPGGVRFES